MKRSTPSPRLRHRIPLLTGLLLTLAATLLYIAAFGWQHPALRTLRTGAEALDELIYALYFDLRPPEPVTGEVVLIDIDEDSLRDPALGQWPWSRARMAELIQILHEAAPSVIALDIMFSEPDRTSPARLLPALPPEFRPAIPADRLAELDPDRILGHALEGDTPVLLGYAFLTTPNPPGDPTDPPWVGGRRETVPPQPWPTRTPVPLARGIVRAVPEIADGCESEGFLNTGYGRHGTIRSIPLVMAYAPPPTAEAPPPPAVPFPSLALEAFRLHRHAETTIFHLSNDGQNHLLGIEVADRIIPTDEAGRMTLNYRGTAGQFPTFPVRDIVHRRIDLSRLEGRILVVGTSAVGLHDIHATPLGTMPGSEIQATAIDNLLRGDMLRHARMLELGLHLTILLLGGIVLSFVLTQIRPLLAGLATLTVAFGILYGGYAHLFLTHRLLIGSAVPLLFLALLYSVVILFNYLFEGRKSRWIRSAFAHYLSPDVVEELAANPDKLSLRTESRTLTLTFSDIRDFTTISEQLGDGLGDYLRDYLSAMTDIILGHGGTVDKYMGDAIMSFWNAPLRRADHAATAIQACLDQLAHLHILNMRWRRNGLPEMKIGLGIATGEVRIGNMGSHSRFDYTAIGDTVNLASRLEGLTKQYGVGILLSEQTRREAGDAFFCIPIDKVRVKGRMEPVTLFEPIRPGAPSDAQQSESDQWTQALEAYWQQDWTNARNVLERLQTGDHPRKLYAVFLQRVEHFLHAPPPSGWDGVWTFTEK